MKILISAGPTREKIDLVRFLSNRSSGKMGYALAEIAAQSGNEVILVSGPVDLPIPAGVKVIRVISAADMEREILAHSNDCQLIIMAAAVADYRPKNPLSGKMKKSSGDLTLTLERTTDILAELGKRKKVGQILVGFAAESDDLLENAQAKLLRKNLDWIAANDIALPDRGFESDINAVTLLGKSGEKLDFPPAPKREIARQILEAIKPR